MKKVSDKQRKINNQIAKIKQSLEPVCTGCGRYGTDLSHIIRRSRRPDLATDRDNCTIHCRICHDKWDSGDIALMSSLLDFQKNLKYIELVDYSYYNKLIFKIEQHEKEPIRRTAT